MRAVLIMVAASTMAATGPRGVVSQAQQCTSLPYAGLPFAAGSADGQSFTHHFVSKRSVGAWHGTVNLLANDGQSGSDAPARLCTKCWQIFSKSFTLQNAHGDTLAQVDVDVLSLGWSLTLLDCHGKLLATVKEEGVFVQRLGLNINLKIKVSADQTVELTMFRFIYERCYGLHAHVCITCRGCRGRSFVFVSGCK